MIFRSCGPLHKELGLCQRQTDSDMSSTGTKKGVLEVFKFSCYVGIPICMMSLFANNPDNLEKVIRNRSYVVYPPEGPPLPPPEEIREMIRKTRAASESTKSGV